MKLSFLAKEDLLVTEPGTAQYAGQCARYINRAWDEDLHGFPAQSAPFICDHDSDDGRRLTLLMRRDDCLLAGDAETAAYCGCSYFPHRLIKGTWVLVPATAAKTAKGSE